MGELLPDPCSPVRDGSEAERNGCAAKGNAGPARGLETGGALRGPPSSIMSSVLGERPLRSLGVAIRGRL